ncbi:MAG: hypothetical protein HY000_00060 [Planctomycetes bacterium]|nr:hypothetical protein [Planctomycetota bacterium]
MASRLANTFAAALTIAEVLKPIKEIGVVSDPSSVYSSMRIPLRALEEGLCHASPWEGRLHPAVDNELRVLRQLCLHIQTRCPTYGDVCQFLAGSDLEGAARRGWSAMMALDKGVDPSTNSRDNAIVVRAPDLPTEIPDVGTVDASLDARQHSSVNVTNEKLASVTNAPQNAAPRIPPENRTRPLTLRAAATLLGYQGNRKRRAKQLKNLIDVNAIAFEQLTRQSYVFDRNSFPKESWPKLLPT